MHKILIPKLNANDETCVLTEWCVAAGERVSAGAGLAVVETSKAALEVDAEGEGLLHRLFDEGVEVRVGEPIGYLFVNDAERDAFQRRGAVQAQILDTKKQGLQMTHKARRSMELHGLTEEDLEGIAKRVIRTSDIDKLIESRGDPDGADQDKGTRIELTRHEQAVAQTVSTSRSEIPDAFLLIKVDCGQLLDLLETKNKGRSPKIGVSDALVWLVARMRADHPRFFGRVLNEKTFLPAAHSHIGITLDQGRGLFVPVARDVDALDLEGVAEVLDEYRYKAFRAEFDEADLAGGAFTLSLIAEQDLILSLPVIVPGQVAMLSFCAVTEELFLERGEVRARRVAHLGLAYDHRIISGREAGGFCRDLKQKIEKLGEEDVSH